jgi:outer membrane protein TolC
MAEPAPPAVTLSLEDALRMALEANPTVAAAARRVEQAEERVRQARATYFPQLAAGATASKTWLSENDFREARNQAFRQNAPSAQFVNLRPTGIGGGQSVVDSASFLASSLAGLVRPFESRALVDDSVETYTARVEATWLLFDGFEREFRYAAAKTNVKEFDAARGDVQRRILSAVAAAYYNAQLAREDILIAQADAAFNRRQLQEAQAKRRVGTGSLSDVLNFEVRVNTAQTQLLNAQNSLQVALIGLAELLAFEGARFPAGLALEPLGPETEADLTVPALDVLLRIAGELRPDLVQAAYAVERLEDNVGANRAGYFPDVAVFASREMSDDEGYGVDDLNTTVGVQLSYDIFTGGRRKGQVAEARAAVSEAESTLRETRLLVNADVREAYRNLSTNLAQLYLQRENLENTQRNRDLVEKEYQAGQASLVRLNEAQRDLTQAQGRLALARVALRQAWFNLRTATGETLVPYTDAAAYLPEGVDDALMEAVGAAPGEVYEEEVGEADLGEE